MSVRALQADLPAPTGIWIDRSERSPRTLAALGATLIAFLAVTFALGSSSTWHKHARAGADFFHAHWHFGAHTHPETSAEKAAPPAGAPSERESGEATDYVSLSGPAFEAATEPFEIARAIAESRRRSPDPIPALHNSRTTPRASRAPPRTV